MTFKDVFKLSCITSIGAHHQFSKRSLLDTSDSKRLWKRVPNCSEGLLFEVVLERAGAAAVFVDHVETNGSDFTMAFCILFLATGHTIGSFPFIVRATGDGLFHLL